MAVTKGDVLTAVAVLLGVVVAVLVNLMTDVPALPVGVGLVVAALLLAAIEVVRRRGERGGQGLHDVRQRARTGSTIEQSPIEIESDNADTRVRSEATRDSSIRASGIRIVGGRRKDQGNG